MPNYHHARLLISLIILSLNLWAEDGAVFKSNDVRQLYETAIDLKIGDYGRRMAMSRIETLTQSKDSEISVMANFYMGKALTEGGTPFSKNEEKGLRFLLRASENGSGAASAILAEKIESESLKERDQSQAEKCRAAALVFWAKSYNQGIIESLSRVDKLLPDDAAFVKKNIPDKANRDMIFQVASKLDRQFWQISFAYNSIFNVNSGILSIKKNFPENAVDVLKKAASAKNTDAMYFLGKYLYLSNQDKQMAFSLFTEASKMGHDESTKELNNINYATREADTSNSSTTKSTINPVEISQNNRRISTIEHPDANHQVNNAAVPLPTISHATQNVNLPMPPDQVAITTGLKSENKFGALANKIYNEFIFWFLVVGIPLTIVVCIICSNGKAYMYYNSIDVGLCALFCMSFVLSLMTMPSINCGPTSPNLNSEPINVTGVWCIVFTAALLLTILLLGWLANRSIFKALLTIIPKVTLGGFLIFLGVFTIGSAFAVVDQLKKRQYRKAVTQAAAGAAAGYGYYQLRKYLSNISLNKFTP